MSIVSATFSLRGNDSAPSEHQCPKQDLGVCFGGQNESHKDPFSLSRSDWTARYRKCHSASIALGWIMRLWTKDRVHLLRVANRLPKRPRRKLGRLDSIIGRHVHHLLSEIGALLRTQSYIVLKHASGHPNKSTTTTGFRDAIISCGEVIAEGTRGKVASDRAIF
jgi:hypothetical protein